MRFTMDYLKADNSLEVVILFYHFQRCLITGSFLKYCLIWYNHQIMSGRRIQFSEEMFLLQEQAKQWMNWE